MLPISVAPAAGTDATARAAGPIPDHRVMPPSSLESAVLAVGGAYARVHPKHRYYVAAKLRTDPLTSELFDLVGRLGSLGHVLDAGAGRGQFGLLLLALGAATSVRGFDMDSDKVSAARTAAAAWNEKGSGVVQQGEGDLLTASYQGVDTILLLDVLHYLPRLDQLAVIARASQALSPGGRLIVREVTPGSGLGTRVAQFLERTARKIGFNRGHTMDFIPIADLRAAMGKAGLFIDESRPRGPLNNQLLVGTKG